MSNNKLSSIVQRVLYHHRTQGKAVEGVHIRGITDALRADGVHVDIISLPGADPYVTPKAMSPTQQATTLMKLVARFPEPLFELAELAYNAVASWRLLKYFKQNGPVDFIYERYSLFMFAGVLIARLKKIPIILEVNDSSTVERVRPVFFMKLATAIEGWVFRKADGLVFVSGVFRDRIVGAHKTVAPTIITPNAANIDKFSYTPEQRAQARTRWKLDNKVVCGYLGAFVPWHAIDKFVYAIADQLKQNPDLVLLLVGDGATYPEVDKFVKERGLSNQVIMTGRVPHDDVPGLLAAMDMAILPSAGDYTSPVKLFEFMACGIAPIAPNFLPIQEVLKEGQTGWTFTAGNLDRAVDMVLTKSRNIDELKQVGQAARAYIAAERQWRNNVVQLVDFVMSLKRG
ncbi:MAG: glycosyltransferase family 4 protein [Aquabacterium sp.]